VRRIPASYRDGGNLCYVEGMSDSGEGLIDADARIQELADEREAARRERRAPQVRVDPVKKSQVTSLTLGLSELRRQLETTEHAARKSPLTLAIADLEKRLAQLEAED